MPEDPLPTKVARKFGCPNTLGSVSYTHLDVYKRQAYAIRDRGSTFSSHLSRYCISYPRSVGMITECRGCSLGF